jgi:hypothetical protein
MASTEGIARRVQIQDEGVDTVLRFVLESDQAPSIPVEMRGRQILGLLAEEDRVSLSAEGSVRDQDGVARPNQLQNLTVDCRVRVSRRRWPSRLLGSSLACAIVSAIVGSIATAIAGVVSPIRGNLNPDKTVSPAIFLGLAIACVTYFILQHLSTSRSALSQRRSGP